MFIALCYSDVCSQVEYSQFYDKSLPDWASLSEFFSNITRLTSVCHFISSMCKLHELSLI